MTELLSYSERVVRAGIRRMPDGRYEAEDSLETADGPLPIRVTVEIDDDAVRIDFTGTAAQHDGNLNCPLSVTRSACYFVVRVLTDPDVPASSGAFAPVTVTAPPGCLVNAQSPAAVAAGNTETSSRITDVVMAAFGRALPVPGAGSGDDEQRRARETTASPTTRRSAAGRVPARTPTGRPRSTSRCRTRATRRSRRSSGRIPSAWSGTRCAAARVARGRDRGGDGVVRELRVLAPLRLSVIAQRRQLAPRGAAGGCDGAPGRTLVDGVEQAASVSLDLEPGSVIRIETPGGGGYGPPADRAGTLLE